MKLIDKSAVTEEIERRIKFQNKDRDFNYLQIKELESLLSFLDNLEMKEVDLEKEIQDIHKHFHDYYGIVDSNTGEFAKVEDMIQLARHFFELGIQQSKKRQ